MLPAIVLSKGCKEPNNRYPSKSTRTISSIKSLIAEGAILVVGKGFMQHFYEKEDELSPQRDLHHAEIRHLIKFAHDRNRIWKKEDIPQFVTDGNLEQNPFKYITTIFLQPVEYDISTEWKMLALSGGFKVSEYDVGIRTLSDGVEDIPTSFSISIVKGESIDKIRHHLLPLIHWCTSITIYDGYCVERHNNSLNSKGQVSGLSNLLKWIVEERREMEKYLHRIRVISRQRGKTSDIRPEMTQVFADLVKDIELDTIVKSDTGDDTGIFLGFRPDKMGDRLIVFERGGHSLTYSFGHEGLAMLESNKRKMKALRNFKISGPVEFNLSGIAGRQLISEMKNQGKFIHYPFEHK